MLNLLKTLKDKLLNGRIGCPCGYTTSNIEEAKEHLDTHPLTSGRLDWFTGEVIW